MSGWSCRAAPSGRPRSGESAPASGSRPAPGAASERAARGNRTAGRGSPMPARSHSARRNDRTMPSARPACSPLLRASAPQSSAAAPEVRDSLLHPARITSPQARRAPRSVSRGGTGSVGCYARVARVVQSPGFPLRLVERDSVAIVGACVRIEAKRVEPAGPAKLPEHGLRDVVARCQRERLPRQTDRLPRPAGFGLGEAQEKVQVGVAGVALEGLPELIARRRRNAHA